VSTCRALDMLAGAEAPSISPSGEPGASTRGQKMGRSQPPQSCISDPGPAAKSVSCQVLGCTADMSALKSYNQRFKICRHHQQAESVEHGKVLQRFCQQCARFHNVEDFDGLKRSCRTSLDHLNERRRRQKSSGKARTSSVDTGSCGQAPSAMSEPPIGGSEKKRPWNSGPEPAPAVNDLKPYVLHPWAPISELPITSLKRVLLQRILCLMRCRPTLFNKGFAKEIDAADGSVSWRRAPAAASHTPLFWCLQACEMLHTSALLRRHGIAAVGSTLPSSRQRMQELTFDISIRHRVCCRALFRLVPAFGQVCTATRKLQHFPAFLHSGTQLPLVGTPSLSQYLRILGLRSSRSGQAEDLAHCRLQVLYRPSLLMPPTTWILLDGRRSQSSTLWMQPLGSRMGSS